MGMSTDFVSTYRYALPAIALLTVAFGNHIRSEIAKWNKLVKEANIRAD